MKFGWTIGGTLHTNIFCQKDRPGCNRPAMLASLNICGIMTNLLIPTTLLNLNLFILSIFLFPIPIPTILILSIPIHLLLLVLLLLLFRNGHLGCGCRLDIRTTLACRTSENHWGGCNHC